MSDPDRVGTVDILALAALLFVLMVATFYPESFISPPPRLAGISFVPLNLIIPVITAVSAVCVYLRREALSFDVTDVILLAFFVYVIIRSAFAGSEIAGSAKFAILGAAIFYLAKLALRKERLRNVFLWAVVVAVIIIAGYGLIEFVVQRNIILHDSIQLTVSDPDKGIHRSGSLLAHPVVLGAFIVQAAPFVVLMTLRGPSRRSRYVGGLATALLILTLVLTVSKGSWMAGGLLIAAGLLALLYHRQARLLQVILGSIVVGIVAVIVLWGQIYQEILWRTQGSILVRYHTWEYAIDAYKDEPVFGYGFKQGSLQLRETDFGQKYLAQTSRLLPVDNNYISLLLEQGIIGFLLWIGFIIAVAWTSVRRLVSGEYDRYWLAASLASVGGLAVNAITFEAWIIWPTYLMFMSVAGIICGSQKTKVDTESNRLGR